jgi:hypothetical protein
MLKYLMMNDPFIGLFIQQYQNIIRNTFSWSCTNKGSNYCRENNLLGIGFSRVKIGTASLGGMRGVARIHYSSCTD